MKTLIVDDSQEDVQALTEHLKNYPDIEVVCVCNTAEKGLKAMRDYKPDLLFLDIEMPDMMGLDFIERLDATALRRCKIVVYTAFAGYMLESFRKRAIDFLLKPIDPKDLDGVIQRIKLVKENETLSDGRIFKGERNLLMFLNATDFQLVHLQDICVFRYNSEMRLWEAVVARQEKSMKLKRNVNNKMILSLDSQFVQVHQKYIVNINYLFQVTDNHCSFYPPFEAIDYVIVGSTYRKKLMELFTNI